MPGRPLASLWPSLGRQGCSSVLYKYCTYENINIHINIIQIHKIYISCNQFLKQEHINLVSGQTTSLRAPPRVVEKQGKDSTPTPTCSRFKSEHLLNCLNSRSRVLDPAPWIPGPKIVVQQIDYKVARFDVGNAIHF